MIQYKFDTLTLTASSYNTKISIELPMDSNGLDVFAAFKALMVGLTFSESAFDNAVVQYFFDQDLDKGGPLYGNS
jgi:hypothetical protein